MSVGFQSIAFQKIIHWPISVMIFNSLIFQYCNHFLLPDFFLLSCYFYFLPFLSYKLTIVFILHTKDKQKMWCVLMIYTLIPLKINFVTGLNVEVAYEAFQVNGAMHYCPAKGFISLSSFPWWQPFEGLCFKRIVLVLCYFCPQFILQLQKMQCEVSCIF